MATNMKIVNFNGGLNQCSRFLFRNNLSVSTRTTVGQQLSADWEAKETPFLEFVKNIIVQKSSVQHK